jgi:hypothetical protein
LLLGGYKNDGSVDDSMMIKVIALLPFLNVPSNQASTLTYFIQTKLVLCKETPKKAFLANM